MVAEIQWKEDNHNCQLIEMQKEVESKQQQEKLACEELFNNLYAHVGPQVDAVEPLLV